MISSSALHAPNPHSLTRTVVPQLPYAADVHPFPHLYPQVIMEGGGVEFANTLEVGDPLEGQVLSGRNYGAFLTTR